MKATLQLYGQYLMTTPINYTCTNLADHVEKLNHDDVYRFLKHHQFRPALVWEKARDKIEQCEDGYLIFDDTVLDKRYSYEIEGVRKQWSGNEKAIIKGIGVVNLVYYNPHTKHKWIIDFRVFDPDRDGKTKLDHMQEMLALAGKRGICYKTVLFDSWYATSAMMNHIERLGKYFYTTIKSNRLVDESKGKNPYCNISRLSWNEIELSKGKTVKVKGVMRDMKVKVFRVVASDGDTEYIVTNDSTQFLAEDAQKENAIRWKIEQFHREEKQLTGIEACQCRLNRSQRNHILCSILVWMSLATIGYQTNQTLYQVKTGLFKQFLVQQLRTPLIYFH